MLLKLSYGGQERHRRGSAQAIRRRGFASSRRVVHDGDSTRAQSRRRQRFAAGNGAPRVPLLSSIRERNELSGVDADNSVQQFSQRLSQIVARTARVVARGVRAQGRERKPAHRSRRIESGGDALSARGGGGGGGGA